MITVPIHVAGDIWFNRTQVTEILKFSLGEDIALDLGAEGVSLARLGIIDTVLESGIDPEKVTVINWPNSVEHVPFRRQVHHRASHFFWHHQLHKMSVDYTRSPSTTFGLFVGRRTVGRCKIIYDIHSLYPESCLSLMRTTTPLPWDLNDGIVVENVRDWVDQFQMTSFLNWWQDPPVVSIDGHSVSDQYSPAYNTNQDLIAHYFKFGVEIVCESYCYGESFFPTEKTIRPIAAEKPFIIFGPRHFIQRLREYGFRTYNELWNESYDDLEGVERWEAIKAQLPCIDDQFRQDSRFVSELSKIAKHNKGVLEQIVTRYQPSHDY